VLTIHELGDEKREHFVKMQESVRKDVSRRCFGILQAHFAIIQNSCRLWQIDTIYEVMFACAILHNMIIEDERDNHLEPLFQQAQILSN
jgi:hypothetical protein